MKDYELVEKLEREVFQKTENLNFLKAGLEALDAGIEEKRLTFEKQKQDYDERAKRFQASMEKIKNDLANTLSKLNDAKGLQMENSKKNALKDKIKKIKEAKKKKEPEPTFIEAPAITKMETEPVISPEEIIETVPEETEKNENGKKTCPFCGGEFAPQGFKSHLRKCLADVVDSKEELP